LASAEPRRRRAGWGELCSSDVDAGAAERRFARKIPVMRAAAEFMVGNLRPFRNVNHVV
jgi:hypothetical protein